MNPSLGGVFGVNQKESSLEVRSDGEQAVLEIELLPDGILRNIFSFLDLNSLLLCCTVSKRWNEVGSVDRLYERFHNPEFNEIPKPKLKRWKWYVMSQKIFSSAPPLNGLGTFKYPNGFYLGEWQNGIEHGHGIRYFKDEFTSEGEWREGQKEGYGTEIWVDGTRYDGHYRKNEYHGWGEYHCKDTSYVGQFVDSFYHGRGTLTYPDGLVVAGEWAENEFRRGTLTWPSGMYFRASFRGVVRASRKPEGRGILVWNFPREFYLGEWKDGAKIGSGIFVLEGRAFLQEGDINFDPSDYDGGEISFDVSKEVSIPVLMNCTVGELLLGNARFSEISNIIGTKKK